MKKNVTVLSKKHRLPWINLGIAYLSAAKTVSNKIILKPKSTSDEWRSEVMKIPALFLLRQTLELFIKSVLISHGEKVDAIHDLKKLSKKAKKLLSPDTKTHQMWQKVEVIVGKFSQTKYGSSRMFKENDINATTLRYLQTEELNGYTMLKEINIEELTKEVADASIICETLTMLLDPDPYM